MHIEQASHNQSGSLTNCNELKPIPDDSHVIEQTMHTTDSLHAEQQAQAYAQSVNEYIVQSCSFTPKAYCDTRKLSG